MIPFLLVVLVSISLTAARTVPQQQTKDEDTWVSAVGDPGMGRGNQFMLEGWNFCNRCGVIRDTEPLPRYADCFGDQPGSGPNGNLVSEELNNEHCLECEGDDFDRMAEVKERQLGNACGNTTHGFFWTAMLKNGNYFSNDTTLCHTYRPTTTTSHDNLGFDNKPMNQPSVTHNWSQRDANGEFEGMFSGTWDVDKPFSNESSYFAVKWFTNNATGRRVVRNRIKASDEYPWLMLYFGADAATGLKGGYDWDGRGMITKPLAPPNLNVTFRLHVINSTVNGDFYFLNIASCWKNGGAACDGNSTTDVTRYVLYQTNRQGGCSLDTLHGCPRYHRFINGTIVHRESLLFPHAAYTEHCMPDACVEEPLEKDGRCDHFSNPNQQSLLKLAAHPEWAVHGFPSHVGEGWVGDDRVWQLDVGGLMRRLWFGCTPDAQTDNFSPPITTLNIGPEVGINEQNGGEMTWDVSEFDVTVPS